MTRHSPPTTQFHALSFQEEKYLYFVQNSNFFNLSKHDGPFVPNRDINQRCVVLMMMVRRHPQSLILLPARQVLTHNISDTEPYLHMACGDPERAGSQERYLVCICENCKMLSDHINTLEVKLPKQFMTVIKPKVIKFSTQYPDNVTQEGSIWEVSWSSLCRPGAS